MKGLIKDLGMAAQVFGKAREARKQGAELRVQETVRLPVYKLTKWGETMEGARYTTALRRKRSARLHLPRKKQVDGWRGRGSGRKYLGRRSRRRCTMKP